jgi:hypothetical protein
MKRPKENARPLPQHDYGLALQTAVSWLGDRYLLAEPTPRRREERKEYFVEPRRWHQASVAGVRRDSVRIASRAN